MTSLPTRQKLITLQATKYLGPTSVPYHNRLLDNDTKRSMKKGEKHDKRIS